MIGSLRGLVIDRQAPSELLVEVAGVGYRVHAPTATLAAAPAGAVVLLHVHTHVREDAIVLYGFASLDERRCFEALIGAHGVGPALALAILSAHSPASLRRAVAEEDAAAFTAVPGVGNKTAARLLLELGSRLGGPDLDLPGSGTAGPARVDVRAALSSLGYGSDEVTEAVRG
ncbi:MAG: Holliday junction branch migration protein RuvA, partial [Acidimicrobiales bacterium]